MKPPICHICGNRFFEGGGLIRFKETEEDIEFNKRFEQKGFIGHPSNVFWFCKDHLTKIEAFKILKKTEEI
jgi:hypothetical protein